MNALYAKPKKVILKVSMTNKNEQSLNELNMYIYELYISQNSIL